MLELVTVHNGGCHEGVRSRTDDIRYSFSAFRSCWCARSVDAASRMVQQAGNKSGRTASARSSLQVLLQQRRRIQDPLQGWRRSLGPVAIPEGWRVESHPTRYNKGK